MNPLKYSEVVGLEEKDIDAKIEGFRREMFLFRMDKGAGKVIEKPHHYRVLRKNIARLLTAKNAKQREKRLS